jgi:hypothetical protein
MTVHERPFGRCDEDFEPRRLPALAGETITEADRDRIWFRRWRRPASFIREHQRVHRGYDVDHEIEQAGVKLRPALVGARLLQT